MTVTDERLVKRPDLLQTAMHQVLWKLRTTEALRQVKPSRCAQAAQVWTAVHALWACWTLQPKLGLLEKVQLIGFAQNVWLTAHS